MAKIDIRKAWNVLSQEYQKRHRISPKHIHYGPNVPPEDSLKLLGSLGGKHFLEMGCGGGQCSIAAARKGALAKGVDLSEEQLKFARALAAKNKANARFYHGSFEDLGMIRSNSQDIVFSAYAFQYAKNLKRCFKEAYRVLKKGGIFVFSLDHPIFDIFESDRNLKVHRSYFDTGYREFTWSYRGAKKKVRSFFIFRKIEDIANPLVDAGFRIERILEPRPLKRDMVADYSQYYPYSMLRMVPGTIIFKAVK